MLMHRWRNTHIPLPTIPSILIIYVVYWAYIGLPNELSPNTLTTGATGPKTLATGVTDPKTLTTGVTDPKIVLLCNAIREICV